MSKLTKWMDEKLYREYSDNWDNIHFRELLLYRMKPEFSCLDYGSGRGNVKEMNFKGKVNFISGIDPEEEIFENPYLDEAKILKLVDNHIPYEDSCFDIIIIK